MTDQRGPSSRSGGIPEWQKASPAADPKTEDTASASPQKDTEGVGGGKSAEAGELAKRFLEEKAVKGASLDQKTAFLRSKGIDEATIEKAVDSATSPTAANGPSRESSQQTANTPNDMSSTQGRSDVPPIITYPEFLLHARKPAPLVTVSRLVNTAYAATAVSTAFYVASKYLITPMTDALTDARHDFATHTHSKLDELNAKMRQVASKDVKGYGSRYDDTDDAASVDSDPTELFHRDFGTQTTPSLVAAEVADDSSSDGSEADTKGDPAAKHTAKVDDIVMHCTALTNNDILVATEDKATLDSLQSLHDYLQSLAYPVYTQYGSNNGTFSSNKDNKDDELSRLRAEIRSVKGTLLSARNFPATQRRAGLPQ